MANAEYVRVPATAAQGPDARLAEKLKQIWETPSGIYGWLSTVDHKELGIRYLVTAFAFLILGGIEALIFRIQLAQPNQHLLTPEQYNQLFTMHGITMIFLYAFPVLSGFSVFLFPLVIGARDMALPRLNAFSYWTFLFSGLFLYSGFVVGAGPNDGWFNYVPYASKQFNPGLNIDVYALGMIFLGISTTTGAINFCVTFLRARCPGMSINRVPILTWGTVTANAANIFSVPSVSLAFFLLFMDRQFGTHFFNAAAGGQPLLWQHLFWMFGHPWVYTIVLPAIGLVSDALPFFCRRPLVGYTVVVLGTVTTMILGFGVWVHHMFATGLPYTGLSFFSSASIMIVIPSAVAAFAWTATILTGRPVLTTAFLFYAGFIILFVIGGVSGFMTGSVPVDLQLTDTYFIVAHIHYVLIGWNVFPVIGAIYTWFPKMTGRMLNERLGRWNFWTMFVGFNFGFFPMHISGLAGMPRRIYTYPEGMGWDNLNLIETVGAFVFAIGFALLIINVVVSLKRGVVAGPNPWDASSLEWSTSSPPPPYNFAVIPTVGSGHPLWESRLSDEPDDSDLNHGLTLTEHREQIGSDALDGQPDIILRMPGESLAPIILSLSLAGFFASLLLQVWGLVIASAAIALATALVWLWPRSKLGQVSEQHA